MSKDISNYQVAAAGYDGSSDTSHLTVWVRGNRTQLLHAIFGTGATITDNEMFADVRGEEDFTLPEEAISLAGVLRQHLSDTPDKCLTVEQLQDKYAESDWGHHPKFTRADWISLVAEEETILGYWEWVHRMVQDAEERMKCPYCQADDGLQVVVSTWADLIQSDDNMETEATGDHEWDDDAGARCGYCNWNGLVSDLK